VISELPGAWKQALSRWARANRRARSMIDGHSYPSRNEEYLLYQTLLGSWPFEPMDADRARQYRDRIVGYMLKAMREAKVFTSWLSPSPRHEHAMTRFVEMILAPDNTAFLDDFIAFEQRVARYGIYNSLSQLAIKIGAPGVPDFYQGTEIWDFSLVDPDNRRPVDYEWRRTLLADLECPSGSDRGTLAARLMEEPSDNRLKLYAATTLLRFRRDNRELFQHGSYRPLDTEGAHRDHLFGFARRYGSREALIAVPRLVATLLPDPAVPPLGERVWGETAVLVPDGAAPRYRHVLTGRCLTTRLEGGQAFLRAADVFERFPIALLEAA
jgi:(1->4)-alpha-D-glucan 1-alpha-D-glucosylmutase